MTHLRHLTSTLLGLALLCTALKAQTPEQLAQLDPKDIYFQAWLYTKDAEDLEKKEDYVGAFTKYKKARTLFDTVMVNYPRFKKDMVADRQKLTTDAMEAIHEKALAQQKEQSKGISPLLELPGNAPKPLAIPDRIKKNSLETKEISTLRGEITALKLQLSKIPNSRSANAAALRQAIDRLEQKRAYLASAPLRDQIAELNDEITKLRRERDAMEVSRDQALSAQRKTLRQLEATQRALATAREKEKALLATIEEQRNLNGRVIKGQQDQMDDLRAQMAEKDKLLAEANTRIKDLAIQLEQSQSMVTELKTEREDLLKERESMTTRLGLKENDARQQLITQNVGLSKELIEARKKLSLINNDSNASKNQIIKAKVALETAKSKILSLQKENKASELRLADLEKRLKLAQSDLLAGTKGVAPPLERQESELLRNVVKRLQVQIKAQKKTGNLLVAQATRMGIKDEAWSQAVDQLTEAYTPTLNDIEAEAALSHSVTNRISTTPAERLAAQADLQRLTRDLDRVAHRLFARDDFQAARGNLELIIEEDPGAWPSMVNLGIVQNRLGDPSEAAKNFKQAILVAGEQKVPYAHFLLGDAYYKTELYPEAQNELQSSLSMEPENAKAHVILGNIAGRSGDYQNAEFHFKEAITLDPTLHEPHKNLAVLRYREKKLTEAKVHYRDALRLGAPADPALEEALDIN